jgi:hypothetical protein
VAGRELAAAPITATISGEAGRILAAQPIPRQELSVLAAVYFPDPGRPRPRDSADGLPGWFESREARAFWSGFTHGRALPAAE